MLIIGNEAIKTVDRVWIVVEMAVASKKYLGARIRN